MWKHCALLALLTSGCASVHTKPVAITTVSSEEPEIDLDVREIDFHSVTTGIPRDSPTACCYVLKEPWLVNP